MTQKINGAAYPGLWFERKVAFIKLTFSSDISAIPAAHLFELGTTTAVSSGAVGDSTFGVVESAIVQALKTLETGATVLGISQYNTTTFSVDVVLGHAEAWFSDATGAIPVAGATFPVINAQANLTTAGSAAVDVIGTLVSVDPTFVTYTMEFVYMDGSMVVATAANNGIVLGNGATSGATPVASPTGTQGYCPDGLI